MDLDMVMKSAIKKAIPRSVKAKIKKLLNDGLKISGTPPRSFQARSHSSVIEKARVEGGFSSPRAAFDSDDAAVVVSFYTGEQYYHDAAKKLAGMCEKLGLTHDIVHLRMAKGVTWAEICRQKISFYSEMLRKHRRPIIWVDVDSTIFRMPKEILYSTADVTCFLRNFKYLPSFDPAQFSRLIAPPFLRFSYNRRVLEFLDFARKLERASAVSATDDYFLQEAIMKWDGDLRFMLMKPSDCSIGNAPTSEAIFQNGNSGNVNQFVGSVEQHQIGALAVGRQVRVLTDSAMALIKRGNRSDALAMYRRALQIAPDDFVLLGRFADLLRKSKAWEELDKLFSNARGKKAEALRLTEFLSHLDRGNFQHADAIMSEPNVQASKDFALMKSRRFRFSLDERANQMGLKEDARVPLWWMEQPYPGNFGDIINPYVVERLTGFPPKFTTGPKRVLAIGSIIKFAKEGTQVWGAGCPNSDQNLSKLATYRAVRGPLTRKMVEDCGGVAPEIYGDPAWFLPVLYRPQVEKKHRLGVLMHQVHRSAAVALDPDVKIIDINRVGYDEIEHLIVEMLECEAILTTSLHGLIVAHAYGIPVRHCVVSTAEKQIHGDGMKFDDYFQSVGRDRPTPLDLGQLDRIGIELAAECADNAQRPIDLVALAEAAPFKIKPDVMESIKRWKFADVGIAPRAL